MPMFDRSAGLTCEAEPELLSWKEEGGWATAKAPVAARIANPFEISDQKRFTALRIHLKICAVPTGLGSISQPTQRLRAGLLLFRPCGLAFVATRLGAIS